MENMQHNGLELNDFQQAKTETCELEILHPKTGMGTGAFITLLSVDSKEWRKQSMKLRNENQKIMRKRNHVDAEKYDDDGVKLAAACTVGWRNLYEGDTPIPFTPENALEIYWKHRFIREQVEEFISDIGNFITN